MASRHFDQREDPGLAPPPLARDASGVLEWVIAGEYKSATGAAMEAGQNKVPDPMCCWGSSLRLQLITD